MLSYTVLIPEDNTGFVVLTNSESPEFAIMMNKILDVMTGAPKHDYNADALARQAANDKADAEERAKQDAERVPNTKPTLALAVVRRNVFEPDVRRCHRRRGERQARNASRAGTEFRRRPRALAL